MNILIYNTYNKNNIYDIIDEYQKPNTIELLFPKLTNVKHFETIRNERGRSFNTDTREHV